MALAAEQIIYYKMALISVEPVSNHNEVNAVLRCDPMPMLPRPMVSFKLSSH